MSLIDFVIIFVYLCITVALGLAFRGRQEDAEGYFTADGKMGSKFQSILVGFSLAATLFSGISFLMYPSLVYSKGSSVVLGLVCFPITWIVLKYWFLPRFFAKDTKLPYDIIEKKFNAQTRVIAAIMYIFLRIGWMATLIYAPTLAILAAAGLDKIWFWPIILTIGLSSTLYTTLGGISSIIITEASQFLVIITGIILTVIFVIIKLPVPISEVFTTLNNHGSFKVNWALDFSELLTFWSIVIGITVATVANYVADQLALQRYLTSGSSKSAERSFVFNMFGALAVVMLLAMVGLSLAAWYIIVPDPNLPEKADKVFPYFIATQLPTGMAGMLLAALLAATISSMTSGVNTLSSTITFDLRSKFGRELAPAQKLRFAKITSLVVGLMATFAAGIVDKLGTIFEIIQVLLGVFCGPLLACVIIAVSRLKVSGIIMSIALLFGSLAGIVVFFSSWASLWVAPVSFLTTFIFALLGSLLARKLLHSRSVII